MSTPPLIRVSCYDGKEKIGLTNYSDMVIYDKEQTLVAIRLGGYPESVQAMSDAILGGCELELTGARETIHVTSKGKRGFERKITHDGVYAEAMHFLRDDPLQSLTVGEGDEKSDKESVKLKRNLYFFCKDGDELFSELDRKLAVPLIPEFKDYFISELQNRKLLNPLRICCIGRKFDGWHMSVSEDESEIAAVLEDGLKSGKITIPGASLQAKQVFPQIYTFTQYLHSFGTQIADRIKGCFPPVYNPSHITGKWVRELHETIPGCFAQHVESMADIDRLYDLYQKENKTFYCILSKETARNGYMTAPCVYWNRIKKGFLCPKCGKVQEMTVFDDGSSYTVNADAVFFGMKPL